MALGMLFADAMRRLWPTPAPLSDPGPPSGRKTTFIIPTHNQRHLMDFCLAPLLKEAGPEHRVMVVDDASTDETSEYVRRNYPAVWLVRLKKNRGFAGAVRAGIAACQTPLFALINTDVQVRPGFLAAMLPHFDRPDTFAVCSRIELPGGSLMETGDVAAAFSGILEPYHVVGRESGPIAYAGGASSVFHRARYEALGGFETIYRPLYWEDIELGYRAWRRGWRSAFEPGASVWHQRRAWIGQRFGDVYANETFLRNALLFVWKNVRDRGLLAQHFAYVSARLAREILTGKRTMCLALLRAAPLWGWVMLKRWREHRHGDLADREILAMMSPRDAQEAAPR
jgi:GT2 family glycosyltransferase